MNPKKLQQKLEARKQEIIDGVKCECGDEVVYILINKGSASGKPEYVKCDKESVDIIKQNGEIHFGHLRHTICTR